jgi:molybdopterin-containing oxidoreductase family iron-sulfur binding subunit
MPVIVQPGQAVGTIGLALGYGRKAALKEEMIRFKCLFFI